MTDRYTALTVTLAKDTRDDDAAALMKAIGQLRGVLDVTGQVADINIHVATMRVRNELWQIITNAFWPEVKK